jgi:LmbE family N-acetylglucosaminyl deacetylase
MSFAANKKVLVVISHQDDEALFCGGLLSGICGDSELTVICMSQAKQKRDVDCRWDFFLKSCEILGAHAVTTDFRDARHVWSHVDLFFRKRPDQIDAMRALLKAQLDAVRPEIVITHNEQGEYGHCYHKVVHRLCRQVFDPGTLYFIGVGSNCNGSRQIVVDYDAQKKKQLMECYPSFDATSFSKRFFNGDVITYQPETYIACGLHDPAPVTSSGLTLYSGLTVDFLHFFDRKIRSKAGWC